MCCDLCHGIGMVYGQTFRLSATSYRVLSWLSCWKCGGTGKVDPKPKGK